MTLNVEHLAYYATSWLHKVSILSLIYYVMSPNIGRPLSQLGAWPVCYVYNPWIIPNNTYHIFHLSTMSRYIQRSSIPTRSLTYPPPFYSPHIIPMRTYHILHLSAYSTSVICPNMFFLLLDILPLLTTTPAHSYFLFSLGLTILWCILSILFSM